MFGKKKKRKSTISSVYKARLKAYLQEHYQPDSCQPELCQPEHDEAFAMPMRFARVCAAKSCEAVPEMLSEVSEEAFEEVFEKASEPTLEKALESTLETAFDEKHESALGERMKHLSDTFSEYLMYLIESKGLSNAEVYKRALVDKKVFSKIKNNKDAHPQKMTAMCLCMGAKLNLDETRDLLARAGYALSPSDKRDVIFSFFIENQIYDMIELDIQLEEYELPCLIS